MKGISRMEFEVKCPSCNFTETLSKMVRDSDTQAIIDWECECGLKKTITQTFSAKKK